jgi:hypothetical protein
MIRVFTRNVQSTLPKEFFLGQNRSKSLTAAELKPREFALSESLNHELGSEMSAEEMLE